ncbi:MAG: response regulator [Proteobacteria bacterium]|nr:response regulator [Pseudomonadota bacterium]
MAKPLKLLIAEDSEEDSILLLETLKRADFEVDYERVDTAEALNVALDKRTWDIFLADHSMPRLNVSTALEAVNARGLDLPMIIVSGTIEPSAALFAMRAGARDFIMKVDLTRLVPAIEREIIEAQNRRDQRMVQQQFLHSQKMESIGRLAGGVAHDFNNILMAIDGYCHFLLDACPTGDARRGDVEEIRKAGQRATALTRQLLAFSRQQVLQMKVLDLNGLVADVQKMLKRLIGEDVELELALSAGVGRIKADAGQIEQVIMNLVVNARDAMPKGGLITIETADVQLSEEYTRTHPDVKPGPYVMLAVSDTGIGMDTKTLARIFDPFFTTKEQGKGTGLGLSTVYGIIKQSGGSVYVYSEPGHGTAFKIYLPHVTDSGAPVSAAPAPVQSMRGAETILLVEDDASVRRLLLRLLTQNGYMVLQASDPMEAVILCENHPAGVELLITDIVMPQMHGGELARKLLAIRPNMKVIYMSGYTDQAVVQRDLLNVDKNFLQKPVNPEVLAKKVREVLDNGG